MWVCCDVHFFSKEIEKRGLVYSFHLFEDGLIAKAVSCLYLTPCNTLLLIFHCL